jgi:L-fuconolactonase
MDSTLVIDAHVHFWNPARFPIPWLADVAQLNRRFELQEYERETQGVPVTGMVYIEVGVAPSYALLEAQHIAAIGERDPRLLGIVAAAPLEVGDQVRPYLDELRAISPLMKGVRRNIQDEEATFSVRPAFVKGVQHLAAYGFSCDLCIRHTQLHAVTELVQQCPDVTFILDHLGKPDIKHHQLEPWREQLATLAAFPNAACKISGLVTEANLTHWQIEDLAPYVAHTLAVFGPERVLFGSDWPVMTLASSYQRWIETLNDLIQHLPLEHRRALWTENARRWYRLASAEIEESPLVDCTETNGDTAV